jgi:hypothetical protein
MRGTLSEVNADRKVPGGNGTLLPVFSAGIGSCPAAKQHRTRYLNQVSPIP